MWIAWYASAMSSGPLSVSCIVQVMLAVCRRCLDGCLSSAKILKALIVCQCNCTFSRLRYHVCFKPSSHANLDPKTVLMCCFVLALLFSVAEQNWTVGPRRMFCVCAQSITRVNTCITEILLKIPTNYKVRFIHWLPKLGTSKLTAVLAHLHRHGLCCLRIGAYWCWQELADLSCICSDFCTDLWNGRYLCRALGVSEYTR